MILNRIFGAIKGVVKGIVRIVSGAINLVLGLFTGNLFKPNNPEMGSQRDTGVESRLNANTANKLPVIYGSAWVKGMIIHGENTSNFKTAYYVIALSEAIATAPNYLVNVYWQEYRLNLSGSSNINLTFSTAQQRALFGGQSSSTIPGLFGSIINLVLNTTTQVQNGGLVTGAFDANNNPVTDFNDNIRVQFFANGMPTDRSTLPNTPWFQSPTNTMSGITFAIVTVNYVRDKNIVSLADMTFEIANTMYQPDRAIYDYLTNTTYGCGLPASQVDTAALANLASYANTIISIEQGVGNFMVPRYSTNAVVNTNQDCYSNLGRLAQSCGSFISINSKTNQIGVFVDMPQTTVSYAFNPSNMIGGAQLTRQNLDNTPNRIEYKWKNGSRQTKDQTDNDVVNLPANLIPANAPINQISLAYDYINNQGQARRLAILNLNSEQLDLGINFTTDHRAIGLESGDLITITDPLSGWDAKKFRIGSIAETEQRDGSIKINIDAKEYSDDVYVDGMVVVADPAPNVNTPSTRFISNYSPAAPVISNAMPTAAIPIFYVNLVIPTANRVDYLEVYYSTDPVNNFGILFTQIATTVDGSFAPGPLSIPITTLQGGTYYFNCKYFNSNLASNLSANSLAFTWAPNPTATVSGVSANPSWSPAVVLVPTDAAGNNPVLNETVSLSLYIGLNLANVTNAATDLLMPNSTWRIAMYTATGCTVSAPVYAATNATWAVTGSTSENGSLTATLRYKDASGVVTPIGDTSVVINQQRQGEPSGITVAQSQNPIIFNANANNVVIPGQTYIDTFTVTQGLMAFTYSTNLSANSTFRITPSGSTEVVYSQNNGSLIFTSIITSVNSSNINVLVEWKDRSGALGSNTTVVSVRKLTNASFNVVASFSPQIVILNADYRGIVLSGQSVLVTGTVAASGQNFTYSASGQQPLNSWRITSVIPGAATVTDNGDGTLSVTNTTVASQTVSVTINAVDGVNNIWILTQTFVVSRVNAVVPSILVSPSQPEDFQVPGNINGLVTGYSQLVAYTVSVNGTQAGYSTAATLPNNSWNLAVVSNPVGGLTITNNNNGSFTVTGMATPVPKAIAQVTITYRDSAGYDNIFTRAVVFTKTTAGQPIVINFTASSGVLNADYTGVVKAGQSTSTTISVTQFPNTFTYTTQTAPVPIQNFTISVAQNPGNLTFNTITTSTVTVTSMPSNINQAQLVLRIDYTDTEGNSNFGTITFTVTKNVDNAPGIVTTLTPESFSFQADASGRTISNPVLVTIGVLQNTLPMTYTSAGSLTVNSTWRITSLTSNPAGALVFTDNMNGTVTVTSLSVSQISAQLVIAIQTRDLAGYLGTRNLLVTVGKVQTGGETIVLTLNSYTAPFTSDSNGVVDMQTFNFAGTVTDNGVVLAYDAVGDIQPSMWRIVSLDTSPTGKITAVNNNNGTFNITSIATDTDSGYVDVTVNARDSLNDLRILSARVFVSKTKRAALPNITQTTTGPNAGTVTIGGNAGYGTATVNPSFVGSVDNPQVQFLQGATGLYPTGPLTITAAFAVPGFVAATTNSVTASFSAVAATGLITGSVPTPNPAITVVFTNNGSATVGVQFTHTSGAGIGATAVARTSPVYNTTNGVATVTVGGVTVATIPDGLSATETYSNGQTFVQAANAGAWTPSPVSNVITSVATATVRRGSSVVGLINWSIAFDTVAFTFTATQVSAGQVNPANFSYGTIVSTANQYVRPYTYLDANGTISGIIQIDIVRGGDRGAAGPAVIERYAYFPSDAAAAAAGQPFTADGLNANFFRSPDLTPQSYTHTTRQFVSNVTAGVPYQSTIQFSGTGGGAYQAGLNEIYTETITGGHTTSTVSNAAQTITVSGNTGGLAHPFGTSAQLRNAVWDSANNRYLQYNDYDVYGVTTAGLYTARLATIPMVVSGLSFPIGVNQNTVVFRTSAGVCILSSNDALISANGLDNWTASSIPIIGTAFAKWNSQSGAASVAIAAGTNGTILRSTNGGASWSQITSGVSNSLTSIDTDGAGNWAIGVTGTIGGNFRSYLSSTDNGLTWQPRVAGGMTITSLERILWTGTNWVGVGDGYFVYGNSVTALSNEVLGLPNNSYNGIFFANNLVGIFGNGGVLYTSTTQGANLTLRAAGTSTINGYATNGSGNVILMGVGYVSYTNDSINYTVLANLANSIAISAQYQTSSAGTSVATFTGSISLTPQLTTAATIGADFVAKWNAALPANSISASLDALNNVLLSYAFVGPITPPMFTITQSNANPPSTIAITTPTGGTGSSPSSITYNNLQVATVRSQLQITAAPSINAGVYTWPVSVVTAIGTFANQYTQYANCQATGPFTGTTITLSGGTNTNLFAVGDIVYADATSTATSPTTFLGTLQSKTSTTLTFFANATVPAGVYFLYFERATPVTLDAQTMLNGPVTEVYGSLGFTASGTTIVYAPTSGTSTYDFSGLTYPYTGFFFSAGALSVSITAASYASANALVTALASAINTLNPARATASGNTLIVSNTTNSPATMFTPAFVGTMVPFTFALMPTISLVPAAFGTAQTALQALTTNNYIFLQNNITTASTGTVLFRSAQNANGQAIDIASFFNTVEVAYTANAVNNVVTLTGSNQQNYTDITHGPVSSGTNGTNVLADYTLVKVQDGRAPNSVPSGTQSSIAFTKAGNVGAGTQTALIDYGALVTATSVPSGATPPWTAIANALMALRYYVINVNASTVRIIDIDTTAGGNLSYVINQGSNPTGNIAANQTVIDVGVTEVVPGDPNRWTFPANTGNAVS